MNELDKAAALLAKEKRVKDPWESLSETQRQYWRDQVAATARPEKKQEQRPTTSKRTAIPKKVKPMSNKPKVPSYNGLDGIDNVSVTAPPDKTSVLATAPSYEELKARVQALESRQETRELTFKVSEKGGCSVYGLGRFPVTLYYEQWNRLLDRADNLRSFLEENKKKFKLKE